MSFATPQIIRPKAKPPSDDFDLAAINECNKKVPPVSKTESPGTIWFEVIYMSLHMDRE